MIQQQSRLCIGAMKLMQWPTIARSVSKSLWPPRMKGPIAVSPHSFSSTVAQAQNSNAPQGRKEDENQSEKEDSAQKKSSKPNSQDKKIEPVQKMLDALLKEPGSTESTWDPAHKLPESSEKVLEAVIRVRSITEALKICSSFSPEQRLHALKNLALARTRPLPLIQTLTEDICKSSEDLDMKQLSDFLFLLGKLSYVNVDVLSRTCDAIKLQLINTTQPAVIGSSIASLRKLQWKDPDLLDELSVWILNNFPKFENPSAFIYTLALLNHSPPNLEDLVQRIWRTAGNMAPSHLVNFVWSLHVLNCPFYPDVTRKALNGLYQSSFLTKLGTSDPDVPVWIKLTNLHAISKSSGGQAANFRLPEVVKSKLSNPVKKNHKSTMVSEIAQLLFKDMDTKLFWTHVSTQMGFPIDLVFSLDKKMNAVPLHLASSDCSRVAVMVHSYHECCQPTKEPNGFRILAMRLLEDEYKVVSVPYHIIGSGYIHVHEYFESALGKIVRSQS